MELTRKTFNKGISDLTLAYKRFTLDPEEASVWFEIIKSCIPEEHFLETVYFYCQRSSEPTCPADIINFKLNK